MDYQENHCRGDLWSPAGERSSPLQRVRRGIKLEVTQMRIGGFSKFTTVDYPGELACGIFLVGCNFKCGYCIIPKLRGPYKSRKIENIVKCPTEDIRIG